MKILIADDDAVSRRLMERTLVLSGYEVAVADNGRAAAKELMSANGPRLALLDWMMPGLDGPDVCREVRGKHRQSYVYITLLTSKQSQEDIVAGLEAGADDYLTKPCAPEELKARLRTGHRILELEDRLVEAREDMRFKATHDALTSLWDRGAILTILRRELDRSLREHDSLALLLCDIDYFKQINDAHGHPVGDEVLRQMASRLLNAVRPYDAVGRYGGEEFLLVLNGCDEAQARTRSEQIRKAVLGSRFPSAAGPLPVSISIGALTIGEWDSARPLDPLLGRADAALYRAKANGRNCIAYAESILPMRAEPMKQEARYDLQIPALEKDCAITAVAPAGLRRMISP